MQSLLYMKNILKIETQLKKGMLEFAVLAIINKDKTYSIDIIKNLQDININVTEGTIYPLLKRLTGDKLVTPLWEESKLGSPRKYYIITYRGRDILNECHRQWKKFSKSIDELIEIYLKDV